MARDGTYTIGLDGDWSLRDFYELPHAFGQVYAFHYALVSDAEVRDRDRLALAFASYPWRGGYSAVNFYIALASQVPKGVRPKVNSVHYGSPGWLEMRLLLSAAVSVGVTVAVLVKSASAINSVYTEIYEGLQRRKLLKLEAERYHLQLAAEQIEFVERSYQSMIKAIGLENVAQLEKLAENPLTRLKILLSYYRRVKILADYAAKGKASFPTADQDSVRGFWK